MKYSKIANIEFAVVFIIGITISIVSPDTTQLAFKPSAEFFLVLWAIIFPFTSILLVLPFAWNKKLYLSGLKPGEEAADMKKILGQLSIAFFIVSTVNLGANAFIDLSARTKIIQEGIITSALCHQHRRGEFESSSFNLRVKNYNDPRFLDHTNAKF